MKKHVLSLLALFLSACATVSNPVPDGYAGPVIQLADTGRQTEGTKGEFFSAVEIDGRAIENSLRETRGASHGQGFALSSRYTKRNLPVIPMKVKLVGTHQTAAPVHEIAGRMAGTFFSVEGIVDFKPTEGLRYVVIGDLKKERSCVWIAETESRQPTTEKVCTELIPGPDKQTISQLNVPQKKYTLAHVSSISVMLIDENPDDRRLRDKKSLEEKITSLVKERLQDDGLTVLPENPGKIKSLITINVTVKYDPGNRAVRWVAGMFGAGKGTIDAYIEAIDPATGSIVASKTETNTKRMGGAGGNFYDMAASTVEGITKALVEDLSRQ